MWHKIIKRGEKVGLKLTKAERQLLLTGLVFLHDHVEKAIRSTPPGMPVKISLSDLESLAGHVAGEANHAKSERIEEILSGISEKIEELLTVYAEEPAPANRSLATPPESLADPLLDKKPVIFPVQPETIPRGDRDHSH